MEKVTLPKEVAKAIEHVWSQVLFEFGKAEPIKTTWLTNWQTLLHMFPNEEEVLIEYFKENPVAYVSALADGYEVEKTPKENILKVYEDAKEQHAYCDSVYPRESYYSGRLDGIRLTLDIFGITVKGINEKEGIYS